jgi:hypothetical protein
VWVESVGLLGLVCEGEVQLQSYMFIFGKSFLVFFSFFHLSSILLWIYF